MEKSDNVDKIDKLLDPSSVSVIGPIIAMTTWSQLLRLRPLILTPIQEAQFRKFNEFFAFCFTGLESLLAKVSSQGHVDSLAIHPSPFLLPPLRGLKGWFLRVLIQLCWLARIPLFRVH